MQDFKTDSNVKMVDKIYQAIQFLHENGYEDVVPWFMDCLIEAYPSFAPAHHDRALLAHEQGDMQIALAHFSKAAALAKDNAGFQKSFGDFLHVSQGDLSAAVDQYQKVVILEPDNKEALLMLAHLSTALQRLDDARNYYSAILNLDPGHAQARQCLDKLPDRPAAVAPVNTQPIEQLKTQQDVPVQGPSDVSALESLRQLVRDEPENARAHNDLGVLLYESGEKSAALACYEKAAELAPEELVFQKNLADFYFVELGEVQKALQKYVQALTLDPQDIETLTATGHICMSIGNVEDARVFFERILEIEPWNQDAQELLEQLDKQPVGSTDSMQDREEDLYAAAQALAGSGDLDGAIDKLKALIAREPDNALAYNDIGVLYYESGNKEAALGCYEQAVRLEPDDATFLKNLADFYYFEKSRTEDALKIYVKLLETEPADIDCLIAAGTICMGLGNSDDARVFFERVLQIDPNNSRARQMLSRSETDDGKTGGRAQIIDFTNNFSA